jgi:hypothetical protein
VGTTRLHALMALGADMIAVEQAAQMGWEVVAPLPFGLDLNIAVNAEPETADQMSAVLNGRQSGSPSVDLGARLLREIAAKLRLFELAEQDSHVADLLLHRLSFPDDNKATQDYLTIVAERVAAAGRVMIEQSDILIAIWDGVTPGAIGGTRHTIAVAVNLGTPVIWIDASRPGWVAILRTPEELFALGALPHLDQTGVEALFEATLNPPASDQNERAIRFHTELWHSRSRRRFHAYRRIEALFGATGWRERCGGLVQTYETPQNIALGTGAGILESARSLPGGEDALVKRIEVDILQRFAWADGLSTYLSDAYRGGMVTNFLLSAMAIVVGVAYFAARVGRCKMAFRVCRVCPAGLHHRHHNRRTTQALARPVVRNAARCRIFPPCADDAAVGGRAFDGALATRSRNRMARILCTRGIVRHWPAVGQNRAGLFARGAPESAAGARRASADISRAKGKAADPRASWARPSVRMAVRPRGAIGVDLSAAHHAWRCWCHSAQHRA